MACLYSLVYVYLNLVSPRQLRQRKTPNRLSTPRDANQRKSTKRQISGVMMKGGDAVMQDFMEGLADALEDDDPVSKRPTLARLNAREDLNVDLEGSSDGMTPPGSPPGDGDDGERIDGELSTST